MSSVSAVISEDDWTQGRFRINPYTYQLQYKVKDDYVITIDNKSDKRRASKGSDLLNQLKMRNFNLLESKGITDNGELGFISGYDSDGCASKIEPIVSVINKKDVAKISSDMSEIRNIELGAIPATYIDDGSGDYKLTEDYKLTDGYYNFRFIKGFDDNSVNVDIIGLNGLIYTDIVNLDTYLSSGMEDYRMSVHLSIQFTTKGSDIVSTRDYVIDGGTDQLINIDNKVELEYYGKCIRVLPLSESISECIISRCVVNYERDIQE